MRRHLAPDSDPPKPLAATSGAYSFAALTLVNLTRARDAARGVALAVLNKKQGEEMPLGGPYSDLNERRVA